jgi:tRNA threonylcarbamoyladenosine biosynthesis protein TsaE
MRGMAQGDDTLPTLEFYSGSEAQTIAFGRRLGALLRVGDLLLLFAPFGAGKTHLTKGIAAAFGVDEMDVNSPTFVLINEYEADRAHRRIPIFHVDLYRVETPDELATVGLDDVIAGDGIAIIEWAERAADWFPRQHLAIYIEHTGENERLIKLVPHGERYVDVVRGLENQEPRTGNFNNDG